MKSYNMKIFPKISQINKLNFRAIESVSNRLNQGLSFRDTQNQQILDSIVDQTSSRIAMMSEVLTQNSREDQSSKDNLNVKS